MEIDQRRRLARLPPRLPGLGVQHAHGYGAVGSPDGRELDLADRVRLLGGEVVDAEDLEVVPVLGVEILFPAEVERGVVVQEGLDLRVQGGAVAGFWDGGGR